MNSSKRKITLTGVGILTKFNLFHYTNKGAGAEVRFLPKKERPVNPQKGIEIAPNLKLRLANKEDVEFLSFYPTSIDSTIQYSLKDYVLEYSIETVDTPEAQGEASEKIRHMVNSTITALRLLKHGYIDANVILFITTRGKDKHASIMAEKPGYPFSWEHYQLRTDEIPRLTKLIKKVSQIDFEKRRAFRIALDRFNKSYYDTENEDKLIDYMIAFEALFLKGEKTREQSTIIPIACAMLLGKTEKQRHKIKNLLTLAYKIRNQIVHGSDYQEKLANQNIELEELTKQIEDLLRTSIKKFI